MPARRSPNSRSSDAAPSAAGTAPGPSSTSRPRPRPSRCTMTCSPRRRTCRRDRGSAGVSPRFSWMTSSAPFGVPAGAANAACSSPDGPANRITSAAGADALAAGADALAELDALAEVDAAPLVAGVSSSEHAASRAPAAGRLRPSNASRRNASRRDSRPVDAVLHDLFGQISVKGHLPMQARPRPGMVRGRVADLAAGRNRRVDVEPEQLEELRVVSVIGRTCTERNPVFRQSFGPDPRRVRGRPTTPHSGAADRPW